LRTPETQAGTDEMVRFGLNEVVLAWLDDDRDDSDALNDDPDASRGFWLPVTIKRINVQGRHAYHAYEVDFKASHLEALEFPPAVERRRLIENDTDEW
jgi:hypothetical protein